MGFGSFQGQNSIFLGGSGAILECLEWLKGLDAKDKGCCEVW
jgi:hypothetical protein